MSLAVITDRRFSRQKPVRGSRINSGHPLKPDVALIFNESGGRTVWSPTGAGNCAGNLTWTNGKYGPAAKFTGAGTLATNTTYYLPTTAATIVQIVRCNNQNDTGSGFGHADGGSGDASRCQAHLPYSGAIYWDFGGSSAPNRVSYTPASGFWGAWHVMAFVAGPSGMAIYEDGVLKASSGTAVSRINTSPGFDIGGWSASSLYNTNDVAAHYIYRRELNAAEAGRLTAHPYSFFTPPRAKRVYSISAGGTTSVTIPGGSFSATGQSLAFAEQLAVTQGTLSATGQSPTLGEALAVTQGSVSASGQTPALTEALAVTQGSLSATGQAVSFTGLLSVTQGSITTTGNTPLLTSTLALSSGSLTTSGQILSLSGTQSISPGTLTATGQNIGFAATEGVPLGTLATTGQSVSIGLSLNIDTASIGLTGQTPAFLGQLSVPVGSLGLTGQTPSVYDSGSATVLPAGSISILSQTLNFLGTFSVPSQSPGVVGQACGLASSIAIPAGAIGIVGQALASALAVRIAAGSLSVAGRPLSTIGGQSTPEFGEMFEIDVNSPSWDCTINGPDWDKTIH